MFKLKIDVPKKQTVSSVTYKVGKVTYHNTWPSSIDLTECKWAWDDHLFYPTYLRIASKVDPNRIAELDVDFKPVSTARLYKYDVPGEHSHTSIILKLFADPQRARREIQAFKRMQVLTESKCKSLMVQTLGSAEVEVEHQTIYLILFEYIPGGDLINAIEENKFDSLKSISEAATQITHAVKCLHNAGVMHRDIKPDNILVAPGPTYKLTDFESMCSINTDENDTLPCPVDRMVGATPGFLRGSVDDNSPSQLDDWYAVGVTIATIILGATIGPEWIVQEQKFRQLTKALEFKLERLGGDPQRQKHLMECTLTLLSLGQPLTITGTERPDMRNVNQALTKLSGHHKKRKHAWLSSEGVKRNRKD